MINILSDETINKIAAGEVIERPASIVKELVENSIDAGAKKIAVEVVSGGRHLISVIDDGCGMNPEDAVLAFKRHATSKITSFDDINSLDTLGFRGEALASIAAVARVRLTTRLKSAISGTNVLIENGKTIEVKDTGAPEGTKIEIVNLFANVPVRRKFLKSQSTEMFYIGQVITGFGLTYPEINFSMNEQFIWPGQKNLKDRIYQIFGKDVTEKTLPVKYSDKSISVKGYVSEPSLNYSNRNQQYFLVNGRIIKNRVLDHAVQNAYKTMLPERRFPFLVISIKIIPELIDPNIHPTKKDIRFLRENEIHTIIEETVKTSLVSRMSISCNVLDKEKPPQAYSVFNESKGIYSNEKSVLNETLTFLEKDEEISSGIKIKGQIRNTYILVENEEGLLIIDQHALDERIIYNILCGKINNNIELEKQTLLFPLTIDVSAKEIFMLEKIIFELGKIGFDIDLIGKNSIAVKEIPALAKKININSFIHDMLTEISRDENKKEILFDKLLKMVACRSAIKAGDPLEEREMKNLIIQLVKNSLITCPHGRPIHIKLTSDELEKKFKRK